MRTSVAKIGEDKSKSGKKFESSPSSSLDFMRALLLVALASFESKLCQLYLTPVYGSIPPTKIPSHVPLPILIFTVPFIPEAFVQTTQNLSTLLPLHSFSIPLIFTWLFRYSSQLGPEKGPFVTEACTFYPLLFLTLVAVVRSLQSHCWWVGQSLAKRLFICLLFSGVSVPVRLATASLLARHMGVSFLWTRNGLQLLSSTLYALIFPLSRRLLTILPALYIILTMNPHTMLPSPTAKLNAGLFKHGFALIDRQETNGGYISVLENVQQQYRVMRCDHSLLGGEWLATPERVKDGITSPEPVFSVFTLLEAVRLMQSATTEDPQDRSKESALVM